MSETATKKKEPGMATLVIVLFAICAATALLLGLTNYVTAPFIAANNEKTTQEAMAAVLPANRVHRRRRYGAGRLQGRRCRIRGGG
mgnify:CR=1 FL=1